MIRHVLESINGVGIFPMISLIVFFLIFTGVTVWVVTMPKRKVKHMAELPLEDDSVTKGE
ncbi:MAG TPA: cbb3-type cytochrome c oxidase subunit 3 [Caldithrix abyssi]|uniref:Cbb3-type cytochrome c oxidase subunit 3 n=1 Tax=Caldithrix abyssi TaxID=187145 RepID=A0A7V1LYG2_CALAY|nr:cbb3-type cytochrome c oxidase subunit 3 [Caldithrix abyssi]